MNTGKYINHERVTIAGYSHKGTPIWVNKAGVRRYPKPKRRRKVETYYPGEPCVIVVRHLRLEGVIVKTQPLTARCVTERRWYKGITFTERFIRKAGRG